MPVDDDCARSFRQWLKEGHHAGMQYMANHLELRLNPLLLLPAAQSILVVALNYFPRQPLNKSQYQFAYYAYGQDYHDVVRSKLRNLLQACHPHNADTEPSDSRVCCDTAPLLERYWAWKAGLGWIGKNTQLILPKAGSYFFIGAIITTHPFDHYDNPQPSRCGSCTRCLQACPTSAIGHSRDSFPQLDANRCLSYLTIENRHDIPTDSATHMGNTIYGCDRCQQACPHNRHATPNTTPELQPTDHFLAMQPDDWQHLTPDTYRQLFRHSAVKRAKYEGLMRNIQAIHPTPSPPSPNTEKTPKGQIPTTEP